MKISPSILSCDFSILKEEIQTIVNYSDYLHIDVMDGNFVNNITFGPGLIKDIRKHFDIVFDVHLMIDNPLKYIKQFSDAGSDIITFHYESKSDILNTINEIKLYNKKVGISINPKTNVNVLLPYLDVIDLVLIMSVEPGFGGQSFDLNAIEKIKKINKIKKEKNLNFEIEVDGGINDKTIALVKEAGVDIVVSGSYIFNSKNRKEKIDTLK